jgi:hypothetical protein
MTAANGGADPNGRPERRWAVALLFAGAQRDSVGQVAAALKAQGVRCLYDRGARRRPAGVRARDADDAESGVRARVAAAARGAGSCC